MFYINLLSIVLAVSLDGFGVGITYGMRKIKLTIPALTIIMLCSGTVVFLSMTIGHFIRTVIPISITSIFGSVIFILLGILVLGAHIKEKLALPTFNWGRLPVLRHFTTILSQPHQADKDGSGTISSGEAIVLGIALAMDAFGAGLAAAMLGFPPWIISIFVAMMSGAFLFTGMQLGWMLANYRTMDKLIYLPPVLLIGIGIFNLVQ